MKKTLVALFISAITMPLMAATVVENTLETIKLTQDSGVLENAVIGKKESSIEDGDLKAKETATPVVNEVKSEAIVDIQNRINEQRKLIDKMTLDLAKPIPTKSLQDWLVEVTSETQARMSKHVGLPEKPAVKNEYGGYDKDAWLTKQQEEEFFSSKEYKENKAYMTTELSKFFTELNAATSLMNELATKGETIQKEDVDKIVIPVLPELTPKQLSWSETHDADVWLQLNKGYVDTYVRPQKEKLYELAALNVEINKYEEILKEADKQLKSELSQIEANVNKINSQSDALLASGFEKDETGAIVFNPKINIKMPDVKDFMANCYLLDDNHNKEPEVSKPVEVKEIIR